VCVCVVVLCVSDRNVIRLYGGDAEECMRDMRWLSSAPDPFLPFIYILTRTPYPKKKEEKERFV